MIGLMIRFVVLVISSQGLVGEQSSTEQRGSLYKTLYKSLYRTLRSTYIRSLWYHLSSTYRRNLIVHYIRSV